MQTIERTIEETKEDYLGAKQGRKSSTRKIVPLWTIDNEEKSILEGELRQQILKICTDTKNFTECPLKTDPADPKVDVDDERFPFDINAAKDWAMKAMEQDKLLVKTRHHLVRPKG